MATLLADEHNDDKLELLEPVSEDTYWLSLARDAYESSSDWMGANLKQQIERNLANFMSRHPAGSKYYSDAYKYRSRLFRPKTRAGVNRAVAAAANAFFGTEDVINCAAQDQDDPIKVAGARTMQEILNYRLNHTIPWFQTCLGAFQTTQIMGLVCSHQTWKYKEKVVKRAVIDAQTRRPVLDQNGQPATEDVVQVVRDTPDVELIPIENIRIDPAADWTDPVNTSPYFIHLMPMFYQDVAKKMKSGEWKQLDAGQVLASIQNEFDSTRQARYGKQQDPTGDTHRLITGHTVVWIHKNIIRVGDDDFIYYTCGTDHLLTDPKPLVEAYPINERPYKIGYCTIEAHKLFPQSPVEQSQDLQAALNEVQNSRFDNVQLVLNRRAKVKRGSNVDMAALRRNAPGGGILMSDPERDVIWDAPPDVTRSSYEEQDRLNVDMDEITGMFSNGSIQSNRSLNETVGGMEIMSADANQNIEFALRVFAETWVQPVLQQLVKYEQLMETDRNIIAVAGAKAQIFDRFGDSIDLDYMLRQEMSIKVNVGVGATSPSARLNKVMTTFGKIGEFAPEMLARVNKEEFWKEIFGIMGYQNGDRFIIPQDQLPPPGPNADVMKAEAAMESAKAAGMQAQVAQLEARAKLEASKTQSERLRFDQEKSAVIASLDKEKLDLEERKLSLQEALDRELARMREETQVRIAEINARTQTEIARMREIAEAKRQGASLKSQEKIEKERQQTEVKRAESESKAKEKEKSEAAEKNAVSPNITLVVDNKSGTVKKKVNLERKNGQLTGATVVEETGDD